MGNNLNIQMLYSEKPKHSNALRETTYTFKRFMAKNLNIQTLYGKLYKPLNTFVGTTKTKQKLYTVWEIA